MHYKYIYLRIINCYLSLNFICQVFSFSSHKLLTTVKHTPVTISVTDVCVDCGRCNTTELTAFCSKCYNRVHLSCAGM